MNATQPKRSFYAVFALAGLPALLYQVAWQRVLSLYFGVDVYSTAVTVAAFMAGLGIGSLLGGRVADRSVRPARAYAAIEGLLGIFGILSLPLFSAVGTSLAGHPLEIVAAASFMMLVVPTVLMGMTLPLMCRILIADKAMGKPIAWLYGLNTIGAACGALVGSYFLIGWFGLQGTVYVAAATNILLSLFVWSMSEAPTRLPEEVHASPAAPTSSSERTLLIIALSAASGFTALGYELVWYRLLTILLHGTVYVFGTILFVYLLGIAAGSLVARRTIEQRDPLLRFALAQFLLSAYVLIFFTVLGRASNLPGLRHLLAASFFTSFHPSPELASGERSRFALYSLLDIPLWSVAMLGIPTFAMGYGFPNLMRAATSTLNGVGTQIGKVYFANIVGATLGSLAVGFVFLEHLGSENTLCLLLLVGLSVCLLSALSVRRVTWIAGIAVLTAFLTPAVFPKRGQLVRALHLADFPVVDYHAQEDRTGVVALRTQSNVIAFSEESRILHQTRLYIDGAAHGQADDNGPIAQDPAVRLALAREHRPERVLSIGLGDGVMCATAVADPAITELVIVELNAGLSEVLRQTQRGRLVASSPKVRLVIDDGRRWLWANPQEKFDLIIMFPLHAAHAYYGNLHSREFFDLAAAHLTPEGTLVTRTVDLYSTPRTLTHAFSHVIRVDHFSYLAGIAPIRFDEARLPFPRAQIEQMVEADNETIALHTGEAPLNRDLRPNSEYYLTYPYAWSLVTKIPSERIYLERDRARFLKLISAPKPAPDMHPPDAATHPSD